MRIVTHTLAVAHDDIYDDKSFLVRLDSEGAGSFIVVETENGRQQIAIDPDEWPALRRAISRMVRVARSEPE